MGTECHYFICDVGNREEVYQTAKAVREKARGDCPGLGGGGGLWGTFFWNWTMPHVCVGVCVYRGFMCVCVSCVSAYKYV